MPTSSDNQVTAADISDQALQLLENQGFRNKGMLGKGSFGHVYKVTSSETNSHAAKIIPKWMVNKHELKDWPKFGHPNILRLVETIKMGSIQRVGVIFLTELMNTSLYLRLHDQAFFNLQQSANICRRYFIESASGLAYLHGLGLCHLDFRPENIFLSNSDHAVLGDFSGLCKISKEIGHTPLPSRLRPPEMKKNGKKVLPLGVDLWSCGLLVACLFLGRGFYKAAVLNEKNGLASIEEYTKLFKSLNYVLKYMRHTHPYSNLSQSDADQLVDMMSGFLQRKPKQRISISEAMRYEFLVSSSSNSTSAVLGATEISSGKLGIRKFLSNIFQGKLLKGKN